MILDAALPLAKSGEAVKAGPIGLAVILIMCIGCYFLFKSMSKHLRNVRENFPVDSGPVAPVAPVAPSASASAAAKSVATSVDEVEPKAASDS